MKNALGALVLASVLSVSMAACEVPEDGGTAADRADVNQKGKPAKGGKSQKSDAPKETAGQENARRSAETYLDTSAFSRAGLIKQLKFEGYSQKDAEYGVDAQHADWMKQAAAAAETYLDTSSFSREGLIQQLKFEGFTPEQAAYGAKRVGL